MRSAARMSLRVNLHAKFTSPCSPRQAYPTPDEALGREAAATFRPKRRTDFAMVFAARRGSPRIDGIVFGAVAPVEVLN